MSEWGDNVATEVFIPDGYGRFTSSSAKAKAEANHKSGRFKSKEYVINVEKENLDLRKRIEELEAKLKKRDDLFVLIALENNILDVSDETLIVSYIARMYKLDPTLVMKKTNHGTYPYYRGLVFYLLYKIVGKDRTYKEIGDYFGYSRDAVLYGVREIEEKLTNKKLKEEIEPHIQWVKENIK